MRPVVLGVPPPASNTAQALEWIIRALTEIERASNEDVSAIAESYSETGTHTTTRTINVSSPTAANVAQVLATFLADTRARGVNRTVPT